VAWLPVWSQADQGGSVRIIVELHYTDDEGVHGSVIADADRGGQPQPFAGWLELLRVLEALAPSDAER
jgi:hypothetical protein